MDANQTDWAAEMRRSAKVIRDTGHEDCERVADGNDEVADAITAKDAEIARLEQLSKAQWETITRWRVLIRDAYGKDVTELSERLIHKLADVALGGPGYSPEEALVPQEPKA